MTNHYHVALEAPSPNLVARMAWMQSSYTIRLDRRHRPIGHVLSGSYKAHLVEGSVNGYLRTACAYVHLNPVRARMLSAEERLRSYPWSSFWAYLAAPEHRPGWIRVDRLLGEHGIQQDTAAGRQRFEAWMERRLAQASDPEALKALRRGWRLGGKGFKRQMLLRMEGGLGEHHSGQLHRETAEARAERILAEELSRRGWSEVDLAQRRKYDLDKPALAARLRRETPLTVKAIAARVHLGTSKSANANLHKYMSGRPGPEAGSSKRAKNGENET